MSLFDALKFNAIVDGVERWVLGSQITGIVATIARGLRNNGTIDIDAYDAGVGASSVIIRNSAAPGQTANLIVDGEIAGNKDVSFASNTSFVGTLQHAITAARAWTFPDKSGDVLIRAATTVVGLIGDTRFDAPGASDTSIGFFNSDLTHVCNVVVEGTVQFLTDLTSGAGYRFAGTPTALRTITLPDADITLGGSSSIPSATNAAIHALTPSSPMLYYCTDIPGVSPGVVGALVYYNTLTPGWMRASNDQFF